MKSVETPRRGVFFTIKNPRRGCDVLTSPAMTRGDDFVALLL